MTTPLTREEVAKWTNADLARDDRERVLALLDENATLRRERDEDEEHIYWMGQLVCAAAFVMGQVDGQNEHGRAFAACAYCGHEDPRTPEAMTAHATTCAKHPLGAALRERDEARATADIAKAAAEKAGAERDALREAAGLLSKVGNRIVLTVPPRYNPHHRELERAVGLSIVPLAATAEAARERDARLVAEARAQALREATATVAGAACPSCGHTWCQAERGATERAGDECACCRGSGRVDGARCEPCDETGRAR